MRWALLSLVFHLAISVDNAFEAVPNNLLIAAPQEVAPQPAPDDPIDPENIWGDFAKPKKNNKKDKVKKAKAAVQYDIPTDPLVEIGNPDPQIFFNLVADTSIDASTQQPTSTSFWDKLKNAANQVGNSISNTFDGAKDWAATAASNAKNWTATATQNAWNATKNGWSKTKNATVNLWDTAKNKTKVGLDKMKNITKEEWGKLKNTTKNGWEKMQNMTLSEEWAKLKNTTSNGWNNLRNSTRNGWGKMKNMTKEEWAEFKNTTKNGWGKMKNMTQEEWAKLKNTTSNGWAKLKNGTKNGWDKMKNMTQNGMDKTKNFTNIAMNWTKTELGEWKNDTKEGWANLKNLTKEGWDKLANSTKNGIAQLTNATQAGWANAKNLTMISWDMVQGKIEAMKQESRKDHELWINLVNDSIVETDEQTDESSAPEILVDPTPQPQQQQQQQLPMMKIDNFWEHGPAENVQRQVVQASVQKETTVGLGQAEPFGEFVSNQFQQTLAHMNQQNQTARKRRADEIFAQLASEAQTNIEKLTQSKDSQIFGNLGVKVNENGANVMENGMEDLDPALIQNMFDAAKSLSSALLNFTQTNLTEMLRSNDSKNFSKAEIQEMLTATQQSFQQINQLVEKTISMNNENAGQVMKDIPNESVGLGNVTTSMESAINDAQAALNVDNPSKLQEAIDRANDAIQKQLDALNSVTIATQMTMGPSVAGSAVTEKTSTLSPASLSPDSVVLISSTEVIVIGPAFTTTEPAPVAASAAATAPSSAAVSVAGSSSSMASGVPSLATTGTSTAVNMSSVVSMASSAGVSGSTVSAVVNNASSSTTTAVSMASTASQGASVATTIGAALADNSTTTVPAAVNITVLTEAPSTLPALTRDPGELVPIPDFAKYNGCVINHVDPHSKVSNSAYQEVGKTQDCEALCKAETMFQCQAYTWAGPGSYCMLHGDLDASMVTIQSHSNYYLTDYQCVKTGDSGTGIKTCVFVERGVQISDDLNLPKYRKYRAQSIQYCQQMCSLSSLEKCTSFAYDPTISFYDGYNCLNFHRSLSLTELPRGSFSLYENPCLLTT